MTNRVDVNQVLMQMRALQARAQGLDNASAGSDIAPTLGGKVNNTTAPQFSDMFSQAINKVNEVQKESSALQRAFEQADPNVSLTQVMIASQKSSVAFQAMTQVRNKLVNAYQDIMNMPI